MEWNEMVITQWRFPNLRKCRLKVWPRTQPSFQFQINMFHRSPHHSCNCSKMGPWMVVGSGVEMEVLVGRRGASVLDWNLIIHPRNRTIWVSVITIAFHFKHVWLDWIGPCILSLLFFHMLTHDALSNLACTVYLGWIAFVAVHSLNNIRCGT